MPGARNGIIGEDYGVDIPETTVNDTQLLEEQKAAKYSRSHEYKKLKEHWEARIKFYQSFLPDGRPLTEGTREEREGMWIVANTIIAELNNVMNYYETAEDSIKERNV